MTDVLLVLSTFPDLEKARQTGTLLVEAQLAACVNLCPGIESIYRWQGKVETSTEVLAVFKTTKAVYPALEQKMRELHPYEVPEIVALPVDKISEVYRDWLHREILVPRDQSSAIG